MSSQENSNEMAKKIYNIETQPFYNKNAQY